MSRSENIPHCPHVAMRLIELSHDPLSSGYAYDSVPPGRAVMECDSATARHAPPLENPQSIRLLFRTFFLGQPLGPFIFSYFFFSPSSFFLIFSLFFPPPPPTKKKKKKKKPLTQNSH